jgi:hypothetical protein
MARGSAPRDVEQVFLIPLIRLIRHPRHGPHLGVADPPFGHRRRDPRQSLERAGHPHLLPGSTEVNAALPVEPVRTALHDSAISASNRALAAFK